MNPSVQIADVLFALHLDPREVEVDVSIPAADLFRLSRFPEPVAGRKARRERFITRQIPTLERLGGALSTGEDASGTVQLDCFEAPIRTSGAVQLRGRGRWFLDPRLAPAAIAFEEYAVIALKDQSLLVRPRADLDAARAVAKEVPPADPTTIFGNRPIAPWLRKAIGSSLVDGGGYGRALAIGLFARLWVPKPSSETAIAEVLQGRSPVHCAWKWFSGLSDRSRGLLENEACSQARHLEPVLRDLGVLAVEDRQRWKSAVRRWVLARDDLESFKFLLAHGAPGSELGAGIERLDAAAADQLSMFAGAELVGDARLRAVAWQEPDKWWGQLALRR